MLFFNFYFKRYLLIKMVLIFCCFHNRLFNRFKATEMYYFVVLEVWSLNQVFLAEVKVLAELCSFLEALGENSLLWFFKNARHFWLLAFSSIFSSSKGRSCIYQFSSLWLFSFPFPILRILVITLDLPR